MGVSRGFVVRIAERHNFSPYFEGMKNPFDEFDSEKNQKAYEIEQRQRALERRIRDTKRQTMALRTDMENATDEAARALLERKYHKKAALLQKQNAAYNDFCDENGLKRLQDRLSIAKWNRSQAAKARAAAKAYKKEHEEK